MLSVVVFLPLVAAVIPFAVPRVTDRFVRWWWLGAAAADFVLVVILWADYPNGDGYGYEVNLRWIPSISSGYHIGVDGLSLPLLALTAGLFLACAVYSLRQEKRVRSFAVLFLFLETVSLGLFVALDLILFFVFFDLSIVGMYFVIAGWGHRDAARAAMKFFLYTFVGSLALLVGFIALYVTASPHTFDLVELTRQMPLAGGGWAAGLVLLALGVGFAIKTPTVPFHTWLPPAHTEAPAAGSAILAGVLLKMGTYGFVRIAMPILPDTWRRYAIVFVVVGVVSVLYGALVALGQRDFKRMVAYTSVNHMGYIILAIGAAGIVGGSAAEARQLAVTGAVTQMISHGLITGALFLLAGVLYDRGGTYDLDRFGGLAASAPRFAGLTAAAAFASLGLPGFSGFIAEFQIFTGSLGAAPVATVLAFLGILITAALFLRAFQKVFLGKPNAPAADLTVAEGVSIAPLLLLAVVIGVFPRFLLDLIEPASRSVLNLLAR
ncbi:complex I subunit 4 family protein [Amycolatopsis saalfeldensis]|uniref:NADH dehydrogenase subunit M n=1 Tax=Amycolatopsis saalfeldensis TaxID=394193 RepID=A0A1H8YMU7_9PSEU|nr:NADH-quinone oxidoreductase subunit M [Amycolatopsis saalfeldensis]SEP53524.1 NADH dehydrogenase subunit M [Amycolatopsis saalfeldensis]